MAIVGQFVSRLVAPIILYFFSFMMFWGESDWWKALWPHLFAGAISGAICGFIVVKIYRRVRVIPACIIPLVFLLVAEAGLIIGFGKAGEPLLATPTNWDNVGAALEPFLLLAVYASMLVRKEEFVKAA